ncbi:lipopolysaccharide biosynthesis protein [Bacteroides stercoris]|uniref:lipopolysaccharide biosynthesis protein n=1 Tax=Bacteroides stercoris TaxID=46506 RepID=UPI0022E8199E|nr:oligosaccharide flippase family protein [Bacteroides stercoris]
MVTTTENNKRIARNTLLLYFRMLFLMIISLYTSRIVLNALGVEDFGIYNVAGGVVAMFSILSGSLSAAISRFITYELGKNNVLKLKTIFSSAITIQIGLGIVIAFFAETIGIWFLNTQMNIPIERMTAANWVLQFSIITFIINLISVPYNAVIIAHEKMSAFAYISIFEAIGKLLIAYLITISPIDKLIFYAILMCGVAIAIRLLYGYYCKRHFDECRFHFIWNKQIFQQIFSFAGWNFIGASSAVLRDHGGNIIINLFCGPTVNAARGIAFQVNNAIQGFVSNFMTALNPQITKSYAAKNYTYMMTLIFQGARLSFYMLLLLSLPIIINTHYLLTLWLNTVPEHTVLFVRLVLIFAMSESISGPLITAMLATGNIRNYQIIVGGLQMLNLPTSYILLSLGAIPETVLIVAVLISQCCLMARLYMLKKMIKLKIKDYLKKVYFNIITVSIIAIILPICMQERLAENFINFLLSSLICMLCTYLSIYYIGCSYEERKFIYNKFLILKSKIRHK